MRFHIWNKINIPLIYIVKSKQCSVYISLGPVQFHFPGSTNITCVNYIPTSALHTEYHTTTHKPNLIYVIIHKIVQAQGSTSTPTRRN